MMELLDIGEGSTNQSRYGATEKMAVRRCDIQYPLSRRSHGVKKGRLKAKAQVRELAAVTTVSRRPVIRSNNWRSSVTLSLRRRCRNDLSGCIGIRMLSTVSVIHSPVSGFEHRLA
jgi:hypothetical protein